MHHLRVISCAQCHLWTQFSTWCLGAKNKSNSLVINYI